MDPSTIFLSFLFGAIGVVSLRRAKTDGNIPCAILGIALMVFPYFVEGLILNLAIGAALTYLVWRFWETD